MIISGFGGRILSTNPVGSAAPGVGADPYLMYHCHWPVNIVLNKSFLLQVMYVGSAQARAVIREYEFYFPKKHKKIKKKKSGQVFSESKQDRIKFDVLLTSYEMINLDSASLKPIKWECMVTFCATHCLHASCHYMLFIFLNTNTSL